MPVIIVICVQYHVQMTSFSTAETYTPGVVMAQNTKMYEVSELGKIYFSSLVLRENLQIVCDKILTISFLIQLVFQAIYIYIYIYT